ncbi:MAG: hypothetical protein PHR26_00470 [Candidatus ainarchaeum sp.]|nr:hypothetical protein [Candidatus ainarchaeum sp.]MDD3975804.1 hypothetical protein [Candidatus ainarchaeum sp.]
MNKLYLIDNIYEEEKNRIILYFSKNPLTKKKEFIYIEKFNPSFIIDISKEICENLLSDFKKNIKIEKEENKCIIFAKNYTILQKCSKILSISTNKNIILIEPQRQFLIKKEWSYFDMFTVISKNKIKKINNENKINLAIKEYIKNLDFNEQKILIPIVAKRLILSNILKTKPYENIRNEQILNILFENNFFKKKLVLKNLSKIEYKKKYLSNKKTIDLDFSNIWPYLLQKEYNNISYETMNCKCCKPKSIFETNVLSSSLIEVNFLKNGYYFISKNKNWGNYFHKNNKNKENRINFMKINKLNEIPIGPFYENQKEQIPLIDAFNLTKEKDIKITNKKNSLNWYCREKESFVSEIIHDLKKRLTNIEISINLSNSANNVNTLANGLENTPNFILYITEYKLLNDLLEEIPRFMVHKNTKFYDPLVSENIIYLQKDTLIKVSENKYRFIYNDQKIYTKDKNFIKKINNYFPKINLPIPRLITN